MHVNTEEIIIQGSPGSPGISFGPVHVMARGFSAPDVYEIRDDQVEREQERFEKALEITKEQLDQLRVHIENLSGEEEGKIFDAHLMVLEDKTLLKRVSHAISERRQNAEYAFYAVMQTFLEAMRRVNDSYLRERAADIDDVCQRVLRNFTQDATSPASDRPDHQHILVAYDLSPSDTASIDRNHVLGFATEQGSVNSHTAILARSLGIPAIVGLEGAVIDITTLSGGILDGYNGTLILNPSVETIKKYQEKSLRKKQAQKELETLREKDTATSDGHRITLSANIEFTNELPQVAQSGAEGVGLFRTEFYLLNGGEMPDEHQQEKVYTEVAKAMNPHLTIVRTLDAGGDKISAEPLSSPEPNPFLGWRGVRVSLTRTALFKEQLRGVLRASTAGKLGVMFPMISGIAEVLAAKELLKESMDELHREGVPFDENIQVGVMIEIPSAAVMADEIAKEVDFLSIGTNDLIQYTVAVDRVNPYVANLYKPTHPAVFRLMDMTVRAAKDNGIWTGVCGEMAAQLLLTPLLVGLGVDELSVGPHMVPSIKKAVRSLSQAECAEMMQQVLKMRTSPDIAEISKNMAYRHYPELID
ncbi:phosphoenolpyruvate--protein phosphotransferase [Verrucomicrobiaceae bacterium R5-34]|uniref:Phosphoenolpyruvate-protein phosphotransferase n=1 Tax=Oceaniferula flava TaxID=2800421 RepID=A0AAE2SGD8_9BACT|nr:phosphoenolpyruvate--protein phosphotransferase [Oceaniferula flavus]MBK1830646.1 phosphoenolpyruvate--protein phosphotransferase [Verrucomicrobiaceae bacterium R5-34]MBK1855906.1 phosphoenolpyruvate--protein phosphotransferase [Oceaniferula flavus]MBM1137213.1 phosphoenolpyruvate--protein phosphotransferase [Oceaniferula flavus]